MKNSLGPVLVLFLCCGWPVIVNVAWSYFISRRDWKNMNLDGIEWPWSKK